MMKLKPIGYWYSNLEPNLPHPIDFVDEKFDPQTQDLIIRYLLISTPIQHYRGVSSCRFKCYYPTPGNSDNTDGEYIFPSGFVHYVQEHKVKPPEEFVKKVIANITQILEIEEGQKSIVKRLLSERDQKLLAHNYQEERIEIDWKWWVNQEPLKNIF